MHTFLNTFLHGLGIVSAVAFVGLSIVNGVVTFALLTHRMALARRIEASFARFSWLATIGGANRDARFRN